MSIKLSGKLEFFENENNLILPLEKSFTPEKQKAFHRYLHPYFTKMASNVVQEYIRHFTRPGEVVCDPFCGTGVVGAESLALGRSSVCVDLSPLAIKMSEVLLSNQFDISKYDTLVGELLNRVERDCLRIEAYGGENAILESGKIPAFIKDAAKKAPSLNQILPSNADVRTVRELFDIRQIAVGGILLSEISKITDKKIRNAIELAFCGVLARANLTYLRSSSRGGSLLHNGGPSIFGEYRYHVPSERVYVPMFEMFKRRLKYIRDIKTKSNQLYEAGSINSIVKRGDSRKLSKLIGERSVDYIFTDPPYGAHISYLDLTSMWDAWMGWGITKEDRKSEVIEGGELKKTREEYLSLLSDTMEESYKVLRPGRWMSLVFQHKDPAIWGSIVETFEEVGFQYKNTVVQRTFNTSIHKKKNPVGVLAEQLILNFTRPEKIAIHFNGISVDLALVVENSIIKAIEIYDGATLDDMYNTLTPALIESGHIKKSKDAIQILDGLLQKLCRFNQKSGKYYLSDKKTKAKSSGLDLVMFFRSGMRFLNFEGISDDGKGFPVEYSDRSHKRLQSGLRFIDSIGPFELIEYINLNINSGNKISDIKSAHEFIVKLEKKYTRSAKRPTLQASKNGVTVICILSSLGYLSKLGNGKANEKMLREILKGERSDFQNFVLENISSKRVSQKSPKLDQGLDL